MRKHHGEAVFHFVYVFMWMCPCVCMSVCVRLSVSPDDSVPEMQNLGNWNFGVFFLMQGL